MMSVTSVYVQVSMTFDTLILEWKGQNFADILNVNTLGLEQIGW